MGKGNKYNPKVRVNPIVSGTNQKQMIVKHFDCFKCNVDRNGLSCTGYIKPDADSIAYKIQIKYNGVGVPKVYVRNPVIEKNAKIHRYADDSLCLYYPVEDPWNHAKSIHDTIIPWTAEWLVYYKLFLVTGSWCGPQQPHGKKKIEDK